MELELLKYPIGHYIPNKKPDQQTLKHWILTLEEFPERLEQLIQQLSEESLNWKYRPNGWCIKQVIHHCADSHLNSIIRFKLALTEDKPSIRSYFEDRWAKLPDATNNNVDASILLLKGLHNKWCVLLKSVNKTQLQLEYFHPEHNQYFNIAETIGMYAWHCNHHFAHIKIGIASNGKYN